MLKIQNYGKMSEVVDESGKVYAIGTCDDCLDFLNNNQILGKLKSGTEFTRTDLKVMFDKVCEKDNWKNPIKTRIVLNNSDETELLLKAIEFFAGSKAVISLVYGNTYNVVADGYYATIGA